MAPYTHRWTVMIALVVTGIAAGLAWSLWPKDDPMRANAEDAHLVALGQAVYAAGCASCHGAGLEGQPGWRIRRPDGRLPAPPHDETGHTWHHADAQLFAITKFGVETFAPPGYRSDMPAFKDALSDEEIWAVLAFIKSTWPERERDFQERVTRMNQEARQ